ncbi:MAG: phosphoheptose isomerase [archaeon]|nr:MAG: phosphoheptose isomerase [archaeon]
MDRGGKRIFIIDIDGTVCTHVGNEEGPEKMLSATPFPDSIAEINKLYDQGHFICFFTARLEEHRAPTEKWLRRHGLRYHQVIFNKPRKLPPFTEYHFIDDAHVRATTYKGKFTRLVKKKVEIEAFEE